MTSIVAVAVIGLLGANAPTPAVPVRINDTVAALAFDPARIDQGEAETIAQLVFGLDVQLVTDGPWTAAAR